jgi:prefoldin subunit 5
MSASSPADDLRARLAALQHEIEQVHLEVHELAEEVSDLRRALEGLPGWMRWFVRLPPRP